LSEALSTDFAGVQALFDHVLTRLENRLKGYIDGDKSIIPTAQKGIETQIDNVEARKERQVERVAKLETMYREQYYKMQATLLTMQAQYQNTMSMLAGSAAFFNQQS